LIGLLHGGIMKKPKPPKSIEEVEAYIREKRLNVNLQAFWDYYVATEWYDKYGCPVLSWKGRAMQWHHKDKRTIAAQEAIKAAVRNDEAFKKRIRDDYEESLKAKSTRALLDLKKDGGQLSGLCGWLINEILRNRQTKELMK
jgi:hypothetical protein